MSATTFVTGATGFLGPYLVRELVAAGRPVVALARPTSSREALADLSPPELVWCTGDVTEPAGLERAVVRARELGGGTFDAIHAAGLVSYRTRDAERMRAVNVEGTWNVLAALRRAGAGRVLHVSSIVAVGRAPRGGVADEDSRFDAGGLGVPYVATKRAAEEIALGMTGELDVRAICPGAIFGPSAVASNGSRFLEALARGWTGPFLPPGAVAPVGAADVARGALLALERGARGRRWVLAERVLELRELVALVAPLVGARVPRWTVPRPLWRLVVAGARVADRVHPLDRVTPQSLTMLGERFAASGQRARRELGWDPEPISQVLERTVAALRAAGRLPALR